MSPPPRLTQEEIRERFDAVVSAVCEELQFARARLIRERTRKAGSYRHIAMYLLRLQGVPHDRIGAMFGGFSRSTVQHACLAVEETRDDKATDALLDLLEEQVNVTLNGGQK